jgi:hypothetical protein
MVGYSFLGDSFIRNSTPVYPDAICPFRPLHTFRFLRPARLRTPLLGYGAPHLSARGTSTLLNNALLSAHFWASDGLVTLTAARYDYNGNWASSAGGTFTR